MLKRAKLLGNAGMAGTLMGLLSMVQGNTTSCYMLLGCSAFLLLASNVILSRIHKEAGKKNN